MKTSRIGDEVTIRISAEEAALLVASLGAARHPKMIELMERIVGSPRWKFVHQPSDAHDGLLAGAFYSEVVEREDGKL